MSPRAMIILKVSFQDAAQVPFPEDDDVIRALSTNRSDESFDIRTLPRTLRCNDHFLKLHPGHSPTELFAIDLVAIPQKISRWRLFKKCFHDLLRGPSSRRMLGHIEVNYTPAIVRQYHQHKQHAKR